MRAFIVVKVLQLFLYLHYSNHSWFKISNCHSSIICIFLQCIGSLQLDVIMFCKHGTIIPGLGLVVTNLKVTQNSSEFMLRKRLILLIEENRILFIAMSKMSLQATVWIAKYLWFAGWTRQLTFRKLTLSQKMKI